ncbi:prohibitin family protein [Variovorax sp. OV329]|uniref:prohibitin family protein n=1 Tax=Variovorax sp. OV329 TaxID=1882825 RepID=UPI0008E10C4B|nr:prohibitin family protein [Variovorax sp. OV329]SFM86046.1 SPFH domain, Band 7 family protein [Variovorax sp. OV329]
MEVNYRYVRWGAVGLALLVAGAIVNPLHTVPTGHRGVITVGGNIKGIQSEGYLLLWPWEKLNIFNVRAEQADIEKAEGSTSDLQPVTTSLTVRYSVLPNKVAEVFEQYSKDGNLDSYISTATQETFKAVTAKFTAPELIAKRAIVSNEIGSQLRVKVALYGAHIINIDMRNFSFSREYMAAINEKATQEQLRQAAENKVLTVTAEQKQKVAVAEAEATAQKARADGEAYAALKIATAQADALKVQNLALAQNKDVLELRRIEVELEKARRWDGKLPTNVYGSAPMPFLSIDKK